MSKTNDGHIIVPRGIVPVHSFDLWGTLVIQKELGPKVTSAYRQLMDGKVDAETIEFNAGRYDRLIEGDKSDEIMDNKKSIVDSVEDPLWPVYMKGQIDVDFNGALYSDCLDVMSDIVASGEKYCILTTGASPWVQDALTSVDERVGRAMVKLYSGDKSKPGAYEIAAADLESQGAEMVSHTEDQIKGLKGLIDGQLKQGVHIVYVERLALETRESALDAGVDTFVKDLTDVPYTEIVQK